ncbi:hypothetical protein Zm00014a_034092 [Zea mays]|uniref:Uncharacterized protein n=1 Tax=Zea mays TaxID=4577 RepID=A0A3L6E4R1_MAIZE|nr:hypothetical protein Zm00014a_034092 [Zea mays]
MAGSARGGLGGLRCGFLRNLPSFSSSSPKSVWTLESGFSCLHQVPTPVHHAFLIASTAGTPTRIPLATSISAAMLASARGFWARHRRKILVTLGVAGLGYAAYRFYDRRRAQLVRVEQLRAMEERAAADLVKNQGCALLFFIALLYPSAACLYLREDSLPIHKAEAADPHRFYLAKD